jgi:uncharacterized protein
MFDTHTMIVAGILTGLAFGFLLQKAHVTRYSVILGQFLFKDFTVLKVMLTAIVTGAIGIYAMYGAGYIQHLHIKTAALAATTLGGLIFGVGMALLGYCPGTGVAAIGEGSRHAIAGLIGMIAGAALYAETMPYFQNTLLKAADYGKVSLADITGVSPWVFIAALAAISGIIFVIIERKERDANPELRPVPAK